MENSLAGDRLFLIGSEATRAMSPGLWNPVLEQLGSHWHYEGWDVPAGTGMAGVRARLLDDDVVAANVTMPHKKWAALTADAVTESVRLSGASNLLIGNGHELTAHNTDVTAVTELVAGRNHGRAIIFGAGGAARAALIALRGRVVQVTVADRDDQAAAGLAALASGLGMAAKPVSWAEAQAQAPGASIVFNATPIGKRTNDEPAWGRTALTPDTFVYDFVYARHVTATIAAARRQGLECADGWDHLQAQAAAMVPLLGLASRAYGLLAETLLHIRARS